jgi:UDP-N-acetylmuramoylalanine--D-glutamate ligase
MLCAEDMADAVKKADEFTVKGKACLFSPAAASYNYYKNFEEKGKHFKKLVLDLTK